MQPFKKLLVPTDFSPSSARAADYAVRLAEGLGAEVVLLHVFAFPYDWYYWDVPKLDELRRSVEAHAEEKLRALAERLARPGVTIRPRLSVQSEVTHAILDTADAEHPDLIVMGTTGWTGERPQLGSVAEQVIRRSGLRVLMVHTQATTHSTRPRILVPIDLSETAAAALQVGGALAAAVEGQVVAVHVLPELPFQPDYLGDEPVAAGDLPTHAQRLHAVERFLRDAMGEEPSVEVRLAEGSVVEEAARFADSEQADLVVLGISNRDRVHKAELLALTAPCPVLAVPLRAPSQRPPSPAFEEAVA